MIDRIHPVPPVVDEGFVDQRGEQLTLSVESDITISLRIWLISAAHTYCFGEMFSRIEAEKLYELIKEERSTWYPSPIVELDVDLRGDHFIFDDSTATVVSIISYQSRTVGDTRWSFKIDACHRDT